MDGITFHTWDFAGFYSSPFSFSDLRSVIIFHNTHNKINKMTGQRVYRYTHQLFLTQHALYLVIIRLIEPVVSSFRL